VPEDSEYTKQDDDKLYPCPVGKPLTTGEVALIKGIFGNEINTDIVRKYLYPEERPGVPGKVIPAQTFGTDSIKFYGPRYISADYSQTDNIFNFGSFVHEMTHIWQNQTSAPHTDDINYDYTLTPQSVFSDFGQEEQASIIEDYARQFLYSGKNPSPRRSFGKDDPRTLPLLKKLVEDNFPQAQKTRLAMEEQRRKAAPAARPPQLRKPASQLMRI